MCVGGGRGEGTLSRALTERRSRHALGNAAAPRSGLLSCDTPLCFKASYVQNSSLARRGNNTSSDSPTGPTGSPGPAPLRHNSVMRPHVAAPASAKAAMTSNAQLQPPILRAQRRGKRPSTLARQNASSEDRSAASATPTSPTSSSSSLIAGVALIRKLAEVMSISDSSLTLMHVSLKLLVQSLSSSFHTWPSTTSRGRILRISKRQGSSGSIGWILKAARQRVVSSRQFNKVCRVSGIRMFQN